MTSKNSSNGSHEAATYLLTAMDKSVFKAFEQRPKRSAHGAQHHIRVASLMDDLRSDSDSTLIERMGAMLLLCSYVEGRIRAAYRDRYAIMTGSAFRNALSEAQEYAQASELNKVVRNTAVDVNPLYPQLVVLRRYQDIDQALFDELDRFVKIRNAIAHDAMYRPKAFEYELIEAVNNLVTVTRNMRERIKRKTKKERDNHAIDAHRSSFFQRLVVGVEYGWEQLAKDLNIKTSLVAPLTHARPLYVLAQSTSLQLKIENNEWEMHALWDDLMHNHVRIPVFQKKPNGDNVFYRGYGHLGQVNRMVSDAVYVDVVVLGDV